MSLLGRVEIEAREERELAPYASLASASRGRVYPMAEHAYRTSFQRDRDRIVHCSAFRRMEYKTQVFLPHEGDHFRTRLTHTMEVAQISRTLARNLRLNEDLTEAIALVHDLGHTPFGHSGEEALNELMTGYGGFYHNLQSLRVVDLLEQRYPEHPGLNLSYEVREGIVKHESTHKSIPKEFSPELRPTLEASLVDIVDEIAYSAHDIDDGVRAGLISIDDLRDLSIWLSHPERIGPFDKSLRLSSLAPDQKRHALVRWLVDRLATDVLDETERQIENAEITDTDTLRRSTEKICRYSATTADRVKELKQFLGKRLYRHPTLIELSDRSRKILTTLYGKLSDAPERMPARFKEMLLTEEKEIVVADYIAGMTDRYAEKLSEELKV
ncbi:MAG: deoxyguanosinetriphosphate triphosphohydrolase [candidate division Zixibacteria bacterium]|nr:deoxyguanosinetriphosphate triphosphohydrolase [candidate division Zixibacteria bacterium]